MTRKSDALNRFEKYIAKYGKPQVHTKPLRDSELMVEENRPPKNSNIFARVMGLSEKL